MERRQIAISASDWAARYAASNGPQGVPGALSNQPPSPASAPQQTGQGAAGGAGMIQPGQPLLDANGQPIMDPGTGQPMLAPYPADKRSQSTRNFELDRSISHTKQQQGRVNRLSVAVVILPISGVGLLQMRFSGFETAPRYVQIMMGLYIVMVALFIRIQSLQLPELRKAVEAQDWAAGSAVMQRVRRLVGCNLVIGLVVVAIAGARPMF